MRFVYVLATWVLIAVATVTLTYIVVGDVYPSTPVPEWDGHMPSESLEPVTASALVRSLLQKDVKPSRNLASFVTTGMDEEAKALMYENMNKNFADKEEYAGVSELEKRALKMIAQIFHAPSAFRDGDAVGTATVGSSEASILAFLAFKWRWRARREAVGLPTSSPNIVMPVTAHISLKKFAKFFDVELRQVPVTGPTYTARAKDVVRLVDENTIGVCAILGNTYNGQFDEIEEINDLLTSMLDSKGIDVPLHVDAASGGFVAPFVHPNFKWDFRLPRVKSINVSGHKYGLSFAGLGWLIFREDEDLPKELVYDIDYLGGSHSSFSLNFSRSSHQVIAQFYQLMRYGRKGYSDIMNNLVSISEYLKQQLSQVEQLEINCGELSAPKLPLVAFSLREPSRYSAHDLVRLLKERGWMVPAYDMTQESANVSPKTMMRVVVRNHFTTTQVDELVKDVRECLSELESASSASLMITA